MTAILAEGESSGEALNRAVGRASGTHSIAGNRVEMLIDGAANYAVMHAQIASATTRIHLENYIIHADATGQAFADALMARAREGIKVRVLYDWLGCAGTPRRFWRELREAGAEVCAFGPPSWRDPLLLASRDHRKVFVVDGCRGVTGGLCIGDEWIGNPEKGIQPWRDTGVSIEGPAARLLDAAFESAWKFAGGSAIPSDEINGNVPPMGDIAVRVVATEPGRERAYRTIDLLLGVSASKVWVTEAYLAAPQRLYQAFIDAARDGADVRILLPGASDIRMVRNLTRVGYRGLLKAGVRLYEWQGPMLHAKTIVADGRWVRVGSSNMNASSLLANWELDVFIEDPALAKEMEKQFHEDLTLASEVVRRPRRIATLFGREIPPALAHEKRPVHGHPTHQRTFRERRRQAIVTAGGLIRGARATLFGPLALVLLAAAALFVLFPVPAAYVAAGLATLTAAALIVRALGHRGRT
ncbi:MAG: phospholipase D-like domain-containing protein [Gemmatimonadota bacterium]